MIWDIFAALGIVFALIISFVGVNLIRMHREEKRKEKNFRDWENN